MPSWQSPRASGTRAQLRPGPWMLRTMWTLTQMSQYFSRQGKGQGKKEARAGSEARSPVRRSLAAAHTCRTRWKVDRTLFPGHLHICSLAPAPGPAGQGLMGVTATPEMVLMATSDLPARYLYQFHCYACLLGPSGCGPPWRRLSTPRPAFCCILSPGRRGCWLQSSIYRRGFYPCKAEVLSLHSPRPGLGGGVTTGEAGPPWSRESAFHKHLPTGAFGPVDACRCRQVLSAHQDLGSY